VHVATPPLVSGRPEHPATAVPFTENATDPPPPLGEIVAVSVTVCPTPEGLGEAVTEVVVLVPAMLSGKTQRWNALEYTSSAVTAKRR